ncbi:IS200/IS605 family transposase [Flaviaesturariibacter aridisoli]|uniref:IS200/IS605 family transposase n=1 Tax=Flaviaesturariibacter aridisoli TaxID=2545761 RepID=A0A4R4E356_9BACT|nr:IS200/IS605 family transposase [Flaviaesturariibacter aridisoli]TCZ71756.1 IS200/IS605 family transposase [Flaviaesturariibacter aridisoli]
MSNTWKQSAVHVVFAPKYRQALLLPSIREHVESHMAGKIDGMDHQLMAIYAMPDHVHLLMAISMNMAPAMIMQVIKGETAHWINGQKLLPAHFEWQRGYRWFHISADRVPVVARYIRRQPEHHGQERFVDEDQRLMREQGVDFDPQYGFHEPL